MFLSSAAILYLGWDCSEVTEPGLCWHLLGGRVDTDGGHSPQLTSSSSSSSSPLSLSLSHITPTTSPDSYTTVDSEGTITVCWNTRMIALFNNDRERWDLHWVVFLLFLLSMAGITTLIQLGSNMFIAMDRITIGTFYTQSPVCSRLSPGSLR